jgi:hypothetical protein
MNQMLDKNEVETKIWAWLDGVVIAENLCPFAKEPRQRNQVRLVVSEITNLPQILALIASECEYLTDTPKTETTLIAFSHSLTDFNEYLDALDLAQQLLEDLRYDSTYQLASFHPDYLFEGEPSEDVSHYTNRAPLPMFHLIREASISKALTFVKDTDAIFLRNIEHANKLGIDFFKRFL